MKQNNIILSHLAPYIKHVFIHIRKTIVTHLKSHHQPVPGRFQTTDRRGVSVLAAAAETRRDQTLWWISLVEMCWGRILSRNGGVVWIGYSCFWFELFNQQKLED